MWLLEYQRVVTKTWVLSRISNLENIVAEYCMAAKRIFPRRLTTFEAFDGLEPLPRIIDQANQRYWHIENSRRDACVSIESIIARRVENFQAVQGGNAFSLVLWESGLLHIGYPLFCVAYWSF
jgi:hypothetical protein